MRELTDLERRAIAEWEPLSTLEIEKRHEVLDQNVGEITQIHPFIKKIFEGQQLRPFIDLAYLFASFRKVDIDILIDFIWGFTNIPYFKDDEARKSFENETSAVFDIANQFFKSDFYLHTLLNRFISGEDKLIFGSLVVPISVKQLELFCRNNERFPIIKEHLDGVEDDFIAYKKEREKNRNRGSGNAIQRNGTVTTCSSNTLTINQIALLFVYLGKQITRENGDNIAKQYGHNSGEKLFQRFSHYSSAANRKGKPLSCTPKKLDNKIKLLESVIECLPKDKRHRAVDELSILKNIQETEYE